MRGGPERARRCLATLPPPPLTLRRVAFPPTLPAQSYTELLDELQRAPWEQVLKEIREIASDAVAEQAAGGEVPPTETAAEPEPRPEDQQEQLQQRPASAQQQQQQQRPPSAQRQQRLAPRPVSPAGAGIKQSTLDSFLGRVSRPATLRAEPHQQQEQQQWRQQAEQPMQVGQQQQHEGEQPMEAEAQQHNVQPLFMQQQQQEQHAKQPMDAEGQQDRHPDKEQAAPMGQQQPTAAAGEPAQLQPQLADDGAAHGKKRRRRSEAERLQVRPWWRWGVRC